MSEIFVTNATQNDVEAIGHLYRAVASIEGGLARTVYEITDDYVDHFVSKAFENGLIIIAKTDDGTIVGEIHGYALGPRVFSHLLGELTIAVHPDFQGIGAGKALFNEFMRQIKQDRPDILRVELIARESNAKAIKFYEKLGFVIEGRLQRRIRSVGSGFEADIPMAWLRN